MKVVLQKVQYIILIIAIATAVILCAPQFFIDAAGTGIHALDNAISYLKTILPKSLSIFLVVVAGASFILFFILHITLMRDTRKKLILDSVTGFHNMSYFETYYDATLYKNRKKKYSLILFEIEDYEKYASKVD